MWHTLSEHGRPCRGSWKVNRRWALPSYYLHSRMQQPVADYRTPYKMKRTWQIKLTFSFLNFCVGIHKRIQNHLVMH
jgi:hypothetical protein